MTTTCMDASSFARVFVDIDSVSDGKLLQLIWVNSEFACNPRRSHACAVTADSLGGMADVLFSAGQLGDHLSVPWGVEPVDNESIY